MKDIFFANPEAFYLFILIPLLIVWEIFRQKKKNPAINISTTKVAENIKSTIRVKLRFLPLVLRILVLSIIILILARPQSSSSHQKTYTEGIDIVIALDVSTSMEAKDFKPNRIEAAKSKAIKFIENRPNDRIGLVVFAAESFTQCPITIDHSILKSLFEAVKTGMVEDGTAIGDGLATAINRLKDSKAKSKVIILLSDGINNTGFIAPLTSAEIAHTFGIRIYTIGVGTRGKALYPFKTPYGIIDQYVDVEIDEALLKQIAETTGGKYFRATDNKSLENIYNEIDKLEKTISEEIVYSKFSDEFHPLAWLALILFLIELITRFFIFRKLP